jgi:hypothetical protein
MKRSTFLRLGTRALAIGILAACGGGHDGGTVQPDPEPPPAAAAHTHVVVGWNAVGLQAVRPTKPGPPMTQAWSTFSAAAGAAVFARARAYWQGDA